MDYLFLDACALIYRVEGTAPWAGRLAQRLAELHRQFPLARLAVCDLSRMECRVRPLRAGDRALLAAYDRLFAAAGLEVRPLTPAVIDLATAIRARSGLRPPDALQAASCLSLPGPALFVTGDAGFRREAALAVELI
jgi:predicted nucleic acid-binding protein